MEGTFRPITTVKELANKNLILVGNSVEILNYEHGEFIDSHDIVIRMGKGLPNPHGLEDPTKAIGIKTDVWVTGFLRSNMFRTKQVKKIPIRLLNRTRMHMTSHRELEFDVEHTVMFTDEEILEIYKEFGYKDDSKEGRPSNGFITLLWLIKKAWVWKSLTLIGFDFFAKYYPINVGTAKPQSWHLPTNTATKTPHKGLVEREYALDLKRDGVINWIILSDLKEEILEF